MSVLIARWSDGLELWRLTDEASVSKLRDRMSLPILAGKAWEQVVQGHFGIFVLSPANPRSASDNMPLMITTRNPPRWLRVSYTPTSWSAQKYPLEGRRRLNRAGLWSLIHIVGHPMKRSLIPYNLVGLLDMEPSDFDLGGPGWDVADVPNEIFVSDPFSLLLGEPSGLIAPNEEFVRAYESI